MKKIIALTLLCCSLLWAEKITIFGASSTKLALEEIIQSFKKENPKVSIDVYFSSTGKAFAQFTNGFKYDLFIAADETYPQAIVNNGDAISQPVVYAMGVLALYSTNTSFIAQGLDALKLNEVKKISIANPKLAPYGKAAIEVLEKSNLFKDVSSKIVMGDNISQSVQFVDSGAAEMGLVAFSLISHSHTQDEYVLIHPDYYSPMKQSFVLTKWAKNNPTAHQFAEYLTQEFSQSIFEKYGFGKIQK